MDSNQTPNGLYTVRQAAEILGTTAEAIRSRLNRGTLERVDGEDGRVYVRLDPDHTHIDADHTTDHTVEGSLVFKLQADQIEFLRRELERKDHIIMSLTQRIPELEARESPVGHSDGRDSDGSGGSAPQEQQEPSQRRSWLYRFFFGEDTKTS